MAFFRKREKACLCADGNDLTGREKVMTEEGEKTFKSALM